MAKGIIIYDAVDDVNGVAEMLRHIAGQVEQGYISGINPGWELQDD